jgi:hypothetical protein
VLCSDADADRVDALAEKPAVPLRSAWKGDEGGEGCAKTC